MLSHLARIWKHDYVLISSEPAPHCGNSKINYFLDQCLSRLCDYLETLWAIQSLDLQEF